MEYVLFFGLVLLVATLPSAASMFGASRLVRRGRLRPLALAVAGAFWLAPVVIGAGHGALPLPLGAAIVAEAMGLPDEGYGLSDAFAEQAWVFVPGLVVLTALFAAALRLFFWRWASPVPPGGPEG